MTKDYIHEVTTYFQRDYDDWLTSTEPYYPSSPDSYDVPDSQWEKDR